MVQGKNKTPAKQMPMKRTFLFDIFVDKGLKIRFPFVTTSYALLLQVFVIPNDNISYSGINNWPLTFDQEKEEKAKKTLNSAMKKIQHSMGKWMDHARLKALSHEAIFCCNLQRNGVSSCLLQEKSPPVTLLV